jgi:hypothetical protein
MNIFFLDKDVELCAKYHCDKHIVKMTLESAQLLCSVHWILGNEAPYKLAHKNHPCSIWARGSLSNYIYLCNLGLELCKEYKYRYGRIHSSEKVIEWCLNNVPEIKDIGFTKPPLAMPDKYKCHDTIKSYRDYYINEKTFAKWKFRNVPYWFNNQI